MGVKKSGLGRGLGALIPSDSVKKMELSVNEQGELIQEIDIDLIIPNKSQPRKHFDHDLLVSLSESIMQHGMIQPIIVKPSNGFFEIIAGERRWRASKIAGVSKISSIIKDVDAFTISQLALIENLQRENLSVIEEAMAYDKLITDYHLTQDKLSKIVGKSRSHLTNTLRLLKLESYIQDSIAGGEITHGHGRSLLSIESPKIRKEFFDLILKEGLSVRKAEAIAQVGEAYFLKNKDNKTIKKVNHDVLSIQNDLTTLMGTKVEIKEKQGKGKILIDFYSIEDLNRIIELLNEK